MTNLDSIFKSRDITLPTKVCLVKAMVFPVSGHVCMWELDCEESWVPKNWCFWTVVLRVPWTVGKSNQSILKEISPGCSLEGLLLKLNSNTLATWCEELTHLKRSWCWERLKMGGEGDNLGWDGWMASLIQWMCVWASSWRRWSTGKPGMVQLLGSKRVGPDWVTEQQGEEKIINLVLYSERLLKSFNVYYKMHPNDQPSLI